MTGQVPLFESRACAMDPLVYQILAGNVFGGQHFLQDVDTSEIMDMLIKTGDLVVVARIRAFTGADAIGEVFVNPDLTADGNSILLVNRNQVKAVSKGSPLTTVFGQPTYNTPGDSLAASFFIPGGAGSAGSSTGGVSLEALLVFKPQTNYMIQMRAFANNTAVQIGILFTEGKMSSNAVPSTTQKVFI